MNVRSSPGWQAVKAPVPSHWHRNVANSSASNENHGLAPTVDPLVGVRMRGRAGACVSTVKACASTRPRISGLGFSASSTAGRTERTVRR